MQTCGRYHTISQCWNPRRGRLILYAAYQPRLGIFLQVGFTEEEQWRLQVSCGCHITVFRGVYRGCGSCHVYADVIGAMACLTVPT
jgi:hypothetical protein